MIEREQIVATIDEEKGMVSFDTEPDKATSQQLLLRLSKQIEVGGKGRRTKRGEDDDRGRGGRERRALRGSRGGEILTSSAGGDGVEREVAAGG